MAKAKHGFRCSACGWRSAAFAGRCAQCAAWNTLEEFAEPAAHGRAPSSAVPARVVALSAADETPSRRLVTGIPELDRVLGGGLVPGSLVLIGGDPGIGKSTLMLQAAARLGGTGATVAYVCGEESPRQVRLRAARLGVGAASVSLIPETNLDAALAATAAIGAGVLVIDSIQAMFIEGLESRAGGPAQLAEAGSRLVAWAKGNEVATMVTGHVTKTGDIAGPRLLEHLVDVVLSFEPAEAGTLRILRAEKNRFGATDEVGVFEMTGEGLTSIENPSAAFLEAASSGISGCAVTAVVEGSRPIAVEVQALAVPSYLAAPRRIAAGIESSRLHLLLAVLARRAAINAASLDVVATVSGGLRLKDPASDLAVAAALASAIQDRPLRPGTALLGEVALSGAVRPIPNGARRLAELARNGFHSCIVPTSQAAVEGISIIPVANVREALAAILEPPTRSASYEGQGTRD